MEVKQRNAEIVKNHNAGFNYKELAEMYSINSKTVEFIISTSKRKQFVEDGFFDVHEYDCWIMPTTKQ